MLTHSKSFLQYCNKQKSKIITSQKTVSRKYITNQNRFESLLPLYCNKNVKLPYMAMCNTKLFMSKYSTVPHLQDFKELDFSDINEIKIQPPTSFEVPIYNLEHDQIGSLKLPEYIFGSKVRVDILHRVVVWQLACKRKGTARTKTRSEVSGSSRKLFPQKGRGAARVGSIRSPTRFGGSKAHGPKARSYSYTLPKKIRAFGLRCALASKFAKHQLYIFDKSHIDEAKTKSVTNMMKKFNFDKEGVLFIDGSVVDKNFELAARNIKKIAVLPQSKINVYDILKHKNLAVCKEVIPYLMKRIEDPLKDVYEKERMSS